MATEIGLTKCGRLTTTFFKIEFLMSSLKLVSHFCKVSFLPTQPQDFLKTLKYFLPKSRRKMDKMATKIDRIHSIINAAMQTIGVLYHHKTVWTSKTDSD